MPGIAQSDMPIETVSPRDIRRAAIGLLARRDYSRQELREKLLRRFSNQFSKRSNSASSYLHADGTPDHSIHPPAHPDPLAERQSVPADLLETMIEGELVELASENLQSDERFLESFINGRKAKGHGPYKIRQGLFGKGISNALLQRFLNDFDECWLDLARVVYEKKFSRIPADADSGDLDFKEKARRMRFLQQRGFPSWVMEALFG